MTLKAGGISSKSRLCDSVTLCLIFLFSSSWCPLGTEPRRLTELAKASAMEILSFASVSLLTLVYQSHLLNSHPEAPVPLT